jgi:hypothetical protein
MRSHDFLLALKIETENPPCCTSGKAKVAAPSAIPPFPAALPAYKLPGRREIGRNVEISLWRPICGDLSLRVDSRLTLKSLTGPHQALQKGVSIPTGEPKKDEETEKQLEELSKRTGGCP